MQRLTLTADGERLDRQRTKTLAPWGPSVTTIVILIAVTAAMSVIVSSPAPASAATGWSSIGPDGGGPSALAVSPTDPSVLYGITYEGAVFRTGDEAASWALVGTVPAGFPRDLLVDPGDPDRVYVDDDGQLLASSDGGVSWSPFDQGLTQWTGQIAISRSSPSVLFAASGPSLYRRADGDPSWTKTSATIPSGDFESVGIAPSDANTIYAGFGNGVLRSTDGGATWQVASRGLLHSQYTTDIAVNPRRPAVAFLISDLGLLKTTSAGDIWRPSHQGIGNNQVWQVVYSPHPGEVFAGTFHSVYRSLNGGQSWTPLATPFAYPYQIVPDPFDPSDLFVSADISENGEPAIVRSVDGGSTWSAAANGFRAAVVQSIAVDPIDGRTMYLTADGNLYKSGDTGATWAFEASDVSGQLVIDPIDTRTLYAASRAIGVLKSTDAGAHWSAANTGLRDQWITDLEIDSADPHTLFAASGKHAVWVTHDGAATWQLASDGISDPRMTALAIDPRDPQTLYAGTKVGGIFRSRDGGGSWRSLGTDVLGSRVNDLAVNPVHDRTVYGATTYGGVFKSVNAGVSWSRENSGLPHRRVATQIIFGSRPARLYLATRQGVFRSLDGGQDWQAFSQGLAIPWAQALAISRGGVLFAGTFGASAYRRI